MEHARDWHTYLFKVGNKVLHGGITRNPTRRESEHRRRLDPRGRLVVVGRARTYEGARLWERQHGWR